MKLPGLLLFCCCVFFTACEKAIHFNLNSVNPKIVVEATIENGQEPQVFLTKSVGYFSTITTDILQKSFVHHADIFVSNGTLTSHLKEFALTAPGFDTLYYYAPDPADPANNFLGQFNKKYGLRIVAEGQEYLATTSIPNLTRRIDSLFWKMAPVPADSDKAIVVLRATDPPGYGDYVRYFTQRNQEPFFPGFNSVFDDQVIDGTSYEIQVERGFDRNATLHSAFFNRGDTVTLKLSNIDKATFDFWRTMEFSYGSVGNPFSSPTKVLSNISGDALGYFGGYASQYKTVIIPR